MADKTGLTEQEMLQSLLSTYPARHIANVAHYSRVSCTTLYRILAGERVSRRTYGKLMRLYQERVS
jgi:hypothetical protein